MTGIDADGDGSADDFVDDGWGLGGGVIYRPAELPLGILIDAGWSSFDLDRSALREIDIDNGDVTIWNLSGGGIWSTRSNCRRSKTGSTAA